MPHAISSRVSPAVVAKHTKRPQQGVVLAAQAPRGAWAVLVAVAVLTVVEATAGEIALV